MINQVGNYSLIIALIVSVILIFQTNNRFRNSSKYLDSKLFSLLSVQTSMVLIAFFSLIYAFVVSDFSNQTVYNNSHTTKPLFYKISGTWGNHEGSLLLWLLVLNIFLFIFLIKSKKQSNNYRLLTVLFQEIIILGFLLFILLTSNPFVNLFPIVKEGLGLNPILQDPALAIHPPILYIGYVGTSIIFSSSLAALVCGTINQNWAQHIKKWVIISWIFLTIGIMLGSIWAYYELGWGGFWFWDPVENVSLMPWICLTALLHCVLVLEKRELLKSWTIILSIATFTLSMCGTFLVRSGILNSVHTFANDPSRGLFILCFLFFLITISLIIFIVYNNEKQKNFKKIYFFSKEVSILVNNWFLMYFLSVVFIGTLYPIFLEVLVENKISVGPPFYIKLIVPFLIFFLIFMSIGPNLKWIKETNVKNKIQLIIFFFISLLISLLIYKNIGKTNLINIFLIAASFYLFIVTIIDLFSKESYNFSKKISHFGFSLLILSILLNAILSSEKIINLKVGEKFTFKNEKIFFKSVENNKKENYQSVIGYFTIEDDKKNISLFKPELRIYDQPLVITSEADIKTTLFRDKFLVMNTIKGNEYFNVRYQVKPFMIWIWISTLLLAIGGFLSLYKRVHEK